MRRSRGLASALVVAAAVALAMPQRGDPDPSPVTHPEWARMLLRGLDLDRALGSVHSAARAFAILSWRQSEWWDATDQIPHSLHGMREEAGSPVLLKASAAVGEVSFPVTVVRPGDYGLRVRMAGEPSQPAAVDLVPLGRGSRRSCTLVALPTTTWVEAPKPIRLHPGAYRATFALPQGTLFERFELAPRCIAPIEPLGGWQPTAVMDATDLAVTLVQALDRERELAPADAPVTIAGSEFVADGGTHTPSARLEGGRNGSRAFVSVDVPEDGLYSLAAYGLRAGGQRWTVDGCRSAVTCPLPSRWPGWTTVMTASLAAGHHTFGVDLGPGGSVERVRLERRKQNGIDYVDALRRMGFDPGEGAVTRGKAEQALRWLRRRNRIELGETCFELGSGPVSTPTTMALRRGEVAERQPPSTTPAPTAPPGPPVTPPPPPTLPPMPPATLPCQPPSSPVVPDPCPL